MNNLSITNVKYLGSYNLLCSFNNGVTKQIDMSQLFKFPAYADLQDENEFRQFGLDETIFWANGADIAPEWIFENGVEVA